MINYAFDDNTKTLRIRVEGKVSVEEIASAYNQIASETPFTESLKVLTDCRGAHFDFKLNQIKEIYNAAKLVLDSYSSIKDAIVIDKPYETAIATLFKEPIQLENYNFNIFTTDEAAMRWLL